jgi:hypothetical protein
MKPPNFLFLVYALRYADRQVRYSLDAETPI